jgi:fatty-acyl-CoA synthase
VKLSGLAHVRDRLAAARVLQRRGMVDLLRPDEAVRAFLAMRRYGAFGGLLSYAAARYGDAPAITDDRGNLSFRELDETSNALACGLVANGIRPGAVIATLHRVA